MTVAEIAQAAGALVECDDAERMEQCVRRTAAEVAAEYFPVVATEVVSFTGGEAAFSVLAYAPVKVYAVTRGGKREPFTVGGDRICAGFEGEAEVEYAFIPPDTDPLICHPAVTARTLAYGAAAEYCLLNGLYDDAAVWDKRYRDSLTRLGGGSFKLPGRRWL